MPVPEAPPERPPPKTGVFDFESPKLLIPGVFVPPKSVPMELTAEPVVVAEEKVTETVTP
jgi:hypothetical protein